MNAIDRLVRSNGYKKFMAKLYGWGAAVVIFGALFKILHLPGANIMLILGMGTEVLIFFFSAFEPLHVEYNWALVYPELAIANEEETVEPTKRERKKIAAAKGDSTTQQLDKMLEEAKIGPELIESLASGMRNLGENAKKLAGVSDAAVATDAFVGNMTKAAESVRNLSLKYDKVAASIETDNKNFKLFYYPFIVFVVVAMTNAVNLTDGLDGLAAGTSAIASLCIAYVAYIHGMYLVAGAMLAVAGGALGFLPYNFHPAKIFMGDSGSLFLGFMLATLSVLGTVKSATLIAIVMPVFVLGLPIFDTGFAIIRRLINKQKIMSPDKQHLHHRLMSLGYGQRRATLMIYCVSAIMGIAAILYSRQLYLETLGLFAITCLMIYIFMTDAEHKIPVIKKEKLAKETMTPCEIADNAAREYEEIKEKIDNAEI